MSSSSAPTSSAAVKSAPLLSMSQGARLTVQRIRCPCARLMPSCLSGRPQAIDLPKKVADEVPTHENAAHHTFISTVARM